MEKGGYVYIMTNERHTVLYTGVTSDLARRVTEHKEGRGGAFTRKYNAHVLVFAESFNNIVDAINAEKRIKGGSRSRKIALINKQNPEWKDLSEAIPW